jgi:hypothetical protein
MYIHVIGVPKKDGTFEEMSFFPKFCENYKCKDP